MSISDKGWEIKWDVEEEEEEDVESSDLQTIYIPCKTGILIDFGIRIRNELVDSYNYPTLVDALSESCLKGKTWSDLQYDVNLLINNAENETTTFQINLLCQLFQKSPIWDDISSFNSKLFLNANKLKFNEFKKLNISINFINVIDLSDLKFKLNIAMCSILLNLENKYPIIWNYYSRLVFQSSFQSLQYLHGSTISFNIQWIEILIGFLKQVDKFDVLLSKQLILSKKSTSSKLIFKCIDFFNHDDDTSNNYLKTKRQKK